MGLVVHKYGGTSVANGQALRRVARRVAEERSRGTRVVVVVSAMGQSTDALLDLARELSEDPPRRELDLLLATGETVSAALLVMAIRRLGWDAVSLSGGQCGIRTNGVHGNARILEIRPQRVVEELERGRVVVVTGFQGIDAEGELTTLGRGGSDTSAVALAAALGADHCDIFTDVEGVFTADPRSVPGARRLPRLLLQEMEELAWQGARVLKAEAVEFARDNGVLLRVASSFNDHPPTVLDLDVPAGYRPRRPAVAGVAGRRDLLRVTLAGDVAEGLWSFLAPYDLVFGRANDDGRHELYLSMEEIPTLQSFRARLDDFGPATACAGPLGAVSLVGFGLGSRPASLGAAMAELGRGGVAVLASFTSRESLTFVVAPEAVDEAVARLHGAFVEQPSFVEPALSPAVAVAECGE
jgi:aspartate kinase